MTKIYKTICSPLDILTVIFKMFWYDFEWHSGNK